MRRGNAVPVTVLLAAAALWEVTAALPSQHEPLSAPHIFTLRSKRQEEGDDHTGDPTFSATTSFYIYECDSETQVPVIEQAHKDALVLAAAAFSYDNELSTDNPHQIIDFTTRAAIDFFGPTDFKPSQHQRIYDTLYRATQSYPGWGLSDWWHGRYINVFCNDFADDCTNKKTGAKYAAYVSQVDPKTKTPRTWPWINYCPGFFEKLKSHGDAVTAIQGDTSGTKKFNLKNMRTQATTALHEWMHINNNYTSMICDGGCDDTKQTIGGVEVNTYKSGAAKLLARKDPVLAAKTNDNLAYFAMARFMEKTFGTYPEFPLTWDNSKSPDQNREDEKLQPGEPDPTGSAADPGPSTGSSVADASAELDDGDPNVDGATEATVAADAPLLAASLYPDWYQPVLAAPSAATSLPAVSEPTHPSSLPPSAQPSDLSSVQCNYVKDPGVVDPLYDDCVQAFAQTFVPDDTWTAQPPKPDRGVTAYSGQTSGTCAITIQYGGDWANCGATYGDIWGHARVVFEACANYKLGTVGGSVPFNVENCPGTVAITHTVQAIS